MLGATRFWQEVHHCFDPARPVGVDQPQLHVAREREYNALTVIERCLSAPTGPDRHRYLLTGAVGNGKSSELNFFATRLTRTRIVVMFDLWGHMQSRVRDPKAMDRLQIWELLGLLGLAVYRAGSERFGHKWTDEPQALERALAALRESDAPGAKAEIDVGKLAHGMTVIAGGAAGAAFGGVVGASAGAAAGETAAKLGEAVIEAVSDATEWTWKLGLSSNKKRGDQDGEVRGVLHAVNRLVTALQSAYGRPLLLVLDGLDRITDPSRTEALFVNSGLLGEIMCDALFTVSMPQMRMHGQRIEPFRLEDLSNVPVLDRNDPRKPGPGIEFFNQLVARRLEHVRALLAKDELTGPDDPLPQAELERLAYYSGGVARDFVTMVRDAAAEVLVDGREQVDGEIVDRVLRQERKRREFYMDKQEIELLEGVIADPLRGLPGGELALNLLREKRLLAYPNNTTWYYPHPLLTLALLGRAGSTS
ncbi:hypothetical protein DB30_07382 [Enhygromyxa salina]|uniref:Orc1-like AAA ATPase domain-containing protein n=1 Tax=Enhygromyxa salina TaxID=215803 RepID=A0A0C2CS03_9BACT|nr:hypothetical protein [Enhygromyxa salina]KIG13966.1 hypothetical protein DB30_07382 [Enhygromyxa salina]